jgi:hypothetical protein
MFDFANSQHPVNYSPESGILPIKEIRYSCCDEKLGTVRIVKDAVGLKST